MLLDMSCENMMRVLVADHIFGHTMFISSKKKVSRCIWVFPKIVVPQNGWFIMENPIKWMIWWYHYFRKHPGVSRCGTSSPFFRRLAENAPCKLLPAGALRKSNLAYLEPNFFQNWTSLQTQWLCPPIPDPPMTLPPTLQLSTCHFPRIQ